MDLRAWPRLGLIPPRDCAASTACHPRRSSNVSRRLTASPCRRLFKKDAHAALVKAGWKPAAGTESSAAASGGQCLQLKATDSIAPKAKIIRERAKLEQSVLPFNFTFACPAELKA